MPSPSALTLDSPFAFRCAGCGRCCHNQAIQINAFEILCLARALGLSTTCFLARHTDNGGLFLRFGQRGACDFLDGRGCRVHAARPLACRLYPLGLEDGEEGGEDYARLRGHPDCPGDHLAEGSLAAYLLDQGVEDYLAVSRRYAALAERLWERLQGIPDPHHRLKLTLRLAGRDQPVWQWLDADRAVSHWGERPLAADPRQAAEAHLLFLTEWLEEELAAL